MRLKFRLSQVDESLTEKLNTEIERLGDSQINNSYSILVILAWLFLECALTSKWDTALVVLALLLWKHWYLGLALVVILWRTAQFLNFYTLAPKHGLVRKVVYSSSVEVGEAGLPHRDEALVVIDVILLPTNRLDVILLRLELWRFYTMMLLLYYLAILAIRWWLFVVTTWNSKNHILLISNLESLLKSSILLFSKVGRAEMLERQRLVVVGAIAFRVHHILIDIPAIFGIEDAARRTGLTLWNRITMNCTDTSTSNILWWTTIRFLRRSHLLAWDTNLSFNLRGCRQSLVVICCDLL